MDDDLARQQQDRKFFDDQWMQEQAGSSNLAPIDPDFIASANQALEGAGGEQPLAKRSVMPWERPGPGSVPPTATEAPAPDFRGVQGLPGEKPAEVRVIVVGPNGLPLPTQPQQPVGLIQNRPDYYSRMASSTNSPWQGIWSILMRTPAFVAAMVMIGGLLLLMVVLWITRLF
jgi:hypothetical protein